VPYATYGLLVIDAKRSATRVQSGGPGWIDLGKRQAKEVSYAVDQYFSNAMKGNQPPKDDKPKVPKAPKQIDL
jgi:SWI/SNF-related matrix-associated actin-dependent regulator of chromatin subfamily A member 5